MRAAPAAPVHASFVSPPPFCSLGTPQPSLREWAHIKLPPHARCHVWKLWSDCCCALSCRGSCFPSQCFRTPPRWSCTLPPALCCLKMLMPTGFSQRAAVPVTGSGLWMGRRRQTGGLVAGTVGHIKTRAAPLFLNDNLQLQIAGVQQCHRAASLRTHS